MVHQRTAFRKRFGFGSWCLLGLVATLCPALRLSRPLAPPKIKVTRRHYRELDQEDESSRRLLGMRPWKLSRRRRRQGRFENRELQTQVDQTKKPWVDQTQAKILKESFLDKPKKEQRIVRNVQELRKAILDDGLELRQVENAATEAELQVSQLLQHDVIQLIAKRYEQRSTPGNRKDPHKLALSIEGGGMRGAVSAGMAAAIASLGLCDAFDVIYGASAGSVIGAYMVSRQVCVDVYTDVLPAAQAQFVCKKRLIASLLVTAADMLLKRINYFTDTPRSLNPGMNISFVLDGIMCPQHGLRPLDLVSFGTNNVKQPLRVASSAVHNGKLESLCFGATDFDNNNGGLFKCLEASMTVPGATGPPVPIVHENKQKACFDAFCFEPVPYRSAVEEGATHVLALRSRPEGFVAKTKPGVYEKAVTPLYFQTHGEPTVADFFEKGGQQYIYMEDLLTLEEGRNAGITNNTHKDGIVVPPPHILYGVESNAHVERRRNRKTWNRAHVLPVSLPKGTPELPTLEQDKDEVLTAVRDGFAVAFDLLAPAIGLHQKEMNGERVAQLVFPNVNATFEEIMETPLHVMGNPIISLKQGMAKSIARYFRRKALSLKMYMKKRGQSLPPEPVPGGSSPRCHKKDASTLLESLPGIQANQVPHLASGLLYTKEQVNVL